MTRPYPPRTDATPEQLVQAMFATPAETALEEREYRCSDCGREVGYPETLYRDGRCEDCHPAAISLGS